VLGFALASLLAAPLWAAPTPEQTLYWWQDELRSVAAAVGLARTGQVSEWPHMSVSTGTATLPLPPAVGTVGADGRLDEAAWQQATRFMVGPLFDDWTAGPFYLEVRACHDRQHVYLAMQSPRDVRRLRSLSPAGELFSINGQIYRVDGKPDAAFSVDPSGKELKLTLPLAGPVTLNFPVELLRHPDGRLPPAARSLGLDQLTHEVPAKRPRFRAPTLWLEPIVVRLLPAEAAVQFSRPASGNPVAWAWQLSEKGKIVQQGTIKPKLTAASGVALVDWKAQTGKHAWSLQAVAYVEPIAAQLAAAEQLAVRSKARHAASANQGPSEQALSALAARLRQTAASNPAAWRALYCAAREFKAQSQLNLLDAPLLFVKRHPYFSGHIYDDFYPWHPGGGIYVLPHPDRVEGPREIRAVIDAHTRETLGDGVYRDPELSWDARRIVFSAKQEASGVTSIYEIGIDGRGLHRLTRSDQHSDIQPAYLPDDRIVFISTRPRALVPCNNTGVGTLHTMNADGSNLRSISVNNVTEFDPAIMADGRILYGRWEYVDKTALYMQSLWTMLADGSMEEAFFANNLARPTALLHARPVPESHRVVASLTPHNGQAVGTIATIDPRYGKDNLDEVINFTAEYPVRMDQGLMVGPCHPWPLSTDDLLIANNAIGAHGILELIDRFGHRELVLADADISLYEPMLVKARPRPPVIGPRTQPQQPGCFLVADVYQGLEGISRGSVRRLRLVEDTARTSAVPPGGRWWNQAFLVSWQGSYIVKNILGTVPVEADGSAYFQAPPGRAIYFEALDAQGREVQRMRTFVQAAPGVTRSCIGCHEHKLSAPLRSEHPVAAMLRAPSQPQPESWGSGLIDYATMIQPILDKHCVRCHGGADDIAAGLDFSGGWTWAFNISYETLIKHRMTGFLNCHNGSVHTSALLRPRSIGSGAARLAEILLAGEGAAQELTPAERELLFAWMDTNSNYYGSWDYTPQATCDAILAVKGSLSSVMQKAGCVACHAAGHIGNDWVNLAVPEWSRILRAPLAKKEKGLGLAMCRQRKAREGYPLVDQSVQPPDVLLPTRQPPWDPSGDAKVTFTSNADPQYQAMLAIIRRARAEAIARPRVDMPGAQIVGGQCRMQVPPPLPEAPLAVHARVAGDGAVELCWPRSALTMGLQYELHRGSTPDFVPQASSQIALTTAGRYLDLDAPPGKQYYAMLVTSGQAHSKPVRVTIDVPPLPPPSPPTQLAGMSNAGEIRLTWVPPEGNARFDVYRATNGSEQFIKLNSEPLMVASYGDGDVEPAHPCRYRVTALDRRGQASPPSAAIEVVASARVREPVLVVPFAQNAVGRLFDGTAVSGTLHFDAKIQDGALLPGNTGFVSFEHAREFELGAAFSLDCRVWLDPENQMPIVVGCGAFNHAGWFLQRFGHGWRWHLAGVSCDGGKPATGRWTHLVGTFNGHQAALYQDGHLVGRVEGNPTATPWPGPLLIGQYQQQGPPYQLHGRVKDVKLYRRALSAEEVAKDVP
jgi:hypothetical protein